MVWYLFKNFPQFVVIHTVKGLSVVTEAEIDVFVVAVVFVVVVVVVVVVFLEFPCFLHEPTNVDNLISGSSVFSKSNLYIWKFLVHVLLKLS